ncbi:MAG: winged helix-turn-helix transcriptional regulator [Armatimonadetes bacterium]|nr:winged helix-turn-helix transcriptional regulator [Armatimonadota bacterium]
MPGEWRGIGPITDGALEPAGPGSGQSRIEAEWMDSLKHDGDFLLLWGGAFKAQWPMGEGREPFGITWHGVSFSDTGRAEQVLETPAAHVELILSSLAHEGRIRLLQTLFTGPRTSRQLTEATSLRGGNLHYHLKELMHAHYVEQRDGLYRLTERGAQMLITVACLAHICVEDQGKRGLVVSGWRRG